MFCLDPCGLTGVLSFVVGYVVCLVFVSVAASVLCVVVLLGGCLVDVFVCVDVGYCLFVFYYVVVWCCHFVLVWVWWVCVCLSFECGYLCGVWSIVCFRDVCCVLLLILLLCV